MSIISRTPPLPTAGDVSPLTVIARPKPKLSKYQEKKARDLAKEGFDHEEISSLLSASTEATLQALAALRTRNIAASRKSFNVNIPTWEFVQTQISGKEAMWETMARLLNELVEARTELLWRRALK